MTRVAYVPPILPSSIPQRDLRHDEGFDVVTEELAAERGPPSFPVQPRIVSSAHGPIRDLLLWYPAHDPDAQPWFGSIYADLLSQLPSGTSITLLAHPSVASGAEQLVAASRPDGSVKLLTTPEWVAFSVWAEDAFVVVEDVASDSPLTYLLEPADFPRAGDEFLAEFIAQATPIQATQAPLMFQGGNILIGDSFVLIGRDYLEESLLMAQQQGAIEGFPFEGSDEEQERFLRDLFRRLFDPDREVHFLGSRPVQRPRNRLFRREGESWLEDVERGTGQRQPIFHIDMFISLAGRDSPSGRYRVLVGDPGLADQELGWDTVDHSLQEEFDAIAAQLEDLDFAVTRTPLPYLFADIAGADSVANDEGSQVAIAGSRLWYHATSNNCLVQIDGDERDVWLPTYGHDTQEALAKTDRQHREIWEGLGFSVHQLGDFNPFALRLGALHCIKKYLAR
jgi:hypothetical protein